MKNINTSQRSPIATSQDSSKLVEQHAYQTQLTVDELVKTVRRSTDLAQRVDWQALTSVQHHQKVIELSQLIVNDVFQFLSTAVQGNVMQVVTDFMTTYYADKNTKPAQKQLSPKQSQQQKSIKSNDSKLSKNPQSQPKKQQSFDTFGEDRPFFMTNSNGSFDQKSLNYRNPDLQGTGIFKQATSDLALIKPGLDLSDADALRDVKSMCVKIYRSTNMRYQTIAKLIMRNKKEELRKMVMLKFQYHMPQHMSLVICKINVENGLSQLLFTCGPNKLVDILDLENLKKQSEIKILEGEQIRCAISVTKDNHIFVGCTNGHLLRLDPVNFFTTMEVKLKKHIFCLLQIDEDTILCGQLQGYLDLVRISDGQILISEQLKHKTGNIIAMIKTKSRLHEVVLATQQGIFFVNIRRGGFGLRQEDICLLETNGGPLPYYRQSKDEREVSVLAQDQSKPVLSILNESEYSLKDQQQNEIASSSSKPDVEKVKNKQSYNGGKVTQSFQSSEQSNKSPFKNKKSESGSRSPNRIKQNRQDYVKIQNQKKEYLRTDPVDDGVNGEIEDQMSQRIQVQKVFSNTYADFRWPGAVPTSVLKPPTERKVSQSKQSSLGQKKKSTIVPPSQEQYTFDIEARPKPQVEFSVESEKKREPEHYSLMISEERYLEGLDTRFVEQFDDEKFVACVWGQSDVFIVDREKPELLNSFEVENPSKQNLSCQLLPMFDPVTFPFAFILSQTQLILADLRRLQAFSIAPWQFKGAPHNKNQMEMFLSTEPGHNSEGINLLSLEFDGSNSFVRRLFFSPDFVQALRFLGQD